MAASVLAKMAVQIVANNAQFAAAMKQSSAQMAAFGKTARTVSNSIRAFGVGFGLMEIARGVQYAVSTIADFEKSMSEVRAITNATDSDFKALRDSALELGRSTLFTAKQVSELQVAYGRLGFSTKEILASTAATLELATATGEDLAKSADIAGSTLRAFNLDASEMQRVVDVMAASFNKSALGLDNFGEAIKYVAPVAAAANISLEEVTSMLGVLADAGIRGSMAGTSLRKIISDVKGEAGTLSERLEKLATTGFTGADAMDEVGRTAYASLLILTKNIDKVNEGTIAYSNVTGEAKKMADLMSDNLTGDVTKLTSAFDGLILKFSEGAGPLRDLVQGVTEFITLMSDDDVVRFMKEWLSLVTLIPRKTFEAIGWLRELVTEGNAFEEMAKKRKQAWLDSLVGTPEEIQKTTSALQGQVKAVQDLARAVESAPALSQTAQRAIAGAGVSETTDKSGLGFISVDSDAAIAKMEALRNKSAEVTEEVAANFIDLSGIAGGAIGTFAEALGGAVVGVEDFGGSVLKAFAAFAKEFGTMLIASGVAALALKTVIVNPFGAIAAGAALVALAGAASASVSKVTGSPGSGRSGGAPGQTPSEVKVGGRIKGYDLAIVNDKESYRRGRMG